MCKLFLEQVDPAASLLHRIGNKSPHLAEAVQFTPRVG
jgi:hypothetical protein